LPGDAFSTVGLAGDNFNIVRCPCSVPVREVSPWISYRHYITLQWFIYIDSPGYAFSRFNQSFTPWMSMTKFKTKALWN